MHNATQKCAHVPGDYGAEPSPATRASDPNNMRSHSISPVIALSDISFILFCEEAEDIGPWMPSHRG